MKDELATGSLDVQTNERGRDEQRGYKNLRKALCVGYAGQLAERMTLHNGYRTIGFKSQLVQVHPSSVLGTDDQGMFPEFVVYHELISTSRPYMRNVCAIESSWVIPIVKKLENLNVDKLSGGPGWVTEGEQGKALGLLEQNNSGAVPSDRESRIQAARERFLARKANK